MWGSRMGAIAALAGCLLLVVAGGGCSGARGPAAGAEAATLLAEDGAFLDRVDGRKQPRRAVNEPLRLTPGTYRVVLRRRLESVPGAGRPADFPQRAGRTASGREVFLSATSCALTVTLGRGGDYRASAEAGDEPETWGGAVRGPGVDVACAADTGVARELIGQVRYLCCTTAFSWSGKASDAGYRYPGSSVAPLAAGTPIRVVGAGRDRLTIRTADGGRDYRLYLAYGNARIDAHRYFASLLPVEDPTAALAAAPPDLAAAVAAGELRLGMTRAQAILARGYPPRHRTADLAADDWLYYDSPGRVVRVTFADGVIRSVQPVP